jgi:hypothetical protein
MKQISATTINQTVAEKTSGKQIQMKKRKYGVSLE